MPRRPLHESGICPTSRPATSGASILQYPHHPDHSKKWCKEHNPYHKEDHNTCRVGRQRYPCFASARIVAIFISYSANFPALAAGNRNKTAKRGVSSVSAILLL